MTPNTTLLVRPLETKDIRPYLNHLNASNAESGVDGTGHSHVYSKSDVIDVDEAYDREVTRWSTAITAAGWRRAWGLFDAAALVGHLYLAGGMLASELHRVSMGMGIRRTHHRQGGGTMLLEAALDWARAQPSIDWVDLGVFHDNTAAQALYLKHDFHIVGTTPDRFRLDDGAILTDIAMTLAVSHRSARGGDSRTR